VQMAWEITHFKLCLIKHFCIVFYNIIYVYIMIYI
jgi:hypothetical protein